MHQISVLYSHIHHFYWELIPDYINENHNPNEIQWYFDVKLARPKDPEDLSAQVGKEILANLSLAAGTLSQLQQALALLGGKFPIVMNIIPGGVSNFKITRSTLIHVVRHLEQSKKFIEEIWPQDVKKLIMDVPETGDILDTNLNLISFGSLHTSGERDEVRQYSPGVLLAGKLEPLNELKITESLDSTFYLPKTNQMGREIHYIAPEKPGGITWIKGARYENETMMTGALSRMLVTHKGGGNPEISDTVGRMVDDLELSVESLNCIAGRMLAEVIEGRAFFQSSMQILLNYSIDEELNLQTSFDFSENGVGMGRIESPAGALLHQVFIEDGKIASYRIVGAANWNFAPRDKQGKRGVVERELNRLYESGMTTPHKISRIIHSYYGQVPDGTQ